MTCMTAPGDPRARVEYRIAAADLKVGDLVNTVPGEGDWQQVLGVWRTRSDSTPSDQIRRLVESLDGRYILVQLTDLPPVDGGIYFAAGTAMVAGDSEAEDQSVTDAINTDGERLYLFTKYELVSVRES
jgi:hypothetical protein